MFSFYYIMGFGHSFYFFMGIIVWPAYVSVHHMQGVLIGAREYVGSPGTGIADSCEPRVSAGL